MAAPKPRVEQTKQKIIKAAYEIMCKKGVANTTMMEVAKKSKTSPPLVTYHFESIDRLYIGVLEEILNEMRHSTIEAIQRKHANVRTQLKAYIEVLFLWGERNKEKIQLWVYFYYLASVNEEFAALNDKIRKTGRERIESLLLKGIAHGEFRTRSQAEIENLAILIQGAISGNIIMAASESTLSLRAAAKITSSHIDLLLSH